MSRTMFSSMTTIFSRLQFGASFRWAALAVAAAVLPCALMQAQTKAAAPVAPPSTLLVAVDRRAAIDLDGDWHIIADPYLAGIYSFHGAFDPHGYFNDAEQVAGDNKLIEYGFQKSPTIKVPGDWNTQLEWLRLYEGGLWYERHFDLPAGTPSSAKAGSRSFLHIGAANYKTKAWVNGQYVCEHEGGFTPFDCEITAVAHPGANSVVLLVDDTRIADGVPALKTDWYNYGGVTRDVSVVTVPAAFIDDFDLHLDRATRAAIDGYVHVAGAAAGSHVTVDIPEAKLHTEATTDGDGRATIHIAAPGLTFWTPGQPKLYEVALKASARTAGAAAETNDSLTDVMGFRTIETQGSRILLNGKPIVLHGISIHAEAPYRTGRAYSDKDVATLLGWAQELGCNYVRLAHYPHDQRMTRATDKLGILVWSEVPVYWAEHFDDDAVFQKSQQQLHEMIRRDRDKASVILWSIANETPASDARTAFLTKSANYVRQQDATRLVTAALLVRAEGDTHIIDDKLGNALDVIGFNEYIGWYEGTPESADKTDWKIAFDKPLIVSEFGGGAKAGLHGDEHTRWTEEYQASLFRHQAAMLNRIPQLRGASPWILMDFRSPVRQLPGVQDGFNRKGLISDQGQKKAAFAVLQKAYKDGQIGHAE